MQPDALSLLALAFPLICSGLVVQPRMQAMLARHSDVDFGRDDGEKENENSRRMVREWIPPDSSVLEIGARSGSVSCAIATKQNQSGKVVAVEADLTVKDALDQHLKKFACNVHALNGVVGTTPVKVQVAGRDGQGTFTTPANSGNPDTEAAYHFSLKGGQPTSEFRALRDPETGSAYHFSPAHSFASVEKMFKMHFDTLVVDCEGCFSGMLRENTELVQQVKMILIEAHDEAEEQSIVDLQSKFGFRLIDARIRQRVLVRTCPGYNFLFWGANGLCNQGMTGPENDDAKYYTSDGKHTDAWNGEHTDA